MAEALSNPEMIRLASGDGVEITVDRAVAVRSLVIRDLINDLGTDGMEAIPLPNVTETVLRKVMAWCEQHRDDPPSAGDDNNETGRTTTLIQQWDRDFMGEDEDMVFEVLLAANYLDIKALVDIGCMTCALMAKGKSVEEIRVLFDITNDFTKEEEERIRRENEWAEEGVDEGAEEGAEEMEVGN